MTSFTLDVIDVVVIGLYLLVIIGIGFWVSRRTDTEEDYFMMAVLALKMLHNE